MAKLKLTKEISFDLDLNAYSLEALKQTAAVWRKRAEIFVEEKTKTRLRITLALPDSVEAAQASRISGEFLNEVLNQQYRQMVGRFNKKITEMTVVQALYCASQPGVKDVAASLEPDVAAQREKETQDLMAAARQEIAKRKS